MTLAPFSGIEQRVNSVVFARLANAEVSIDGAAAVAGIFDDGYAVGSVGPLGMAGTQPSVLIADAVVPASVVGRPVVVRGTAYLVAAAEPDGVGATRLVLEIDMEAAQP